MLNYTSFFSVLSSCQVQVNIKLFLGLFPKIEKKKADVVIYNTLRNLGLMHYYNGTFTECYLIHTLTRT